MLSDGNSRLCGEHIDLCPKILRERRERSAMEDQGSELSSGMRSQDPAEKYLVVSAIVGGVFLALEDTCRITDQRTVRETAHDIDAVPLICARRGEDSRQIKLRLAEHIDSKGVSCSKNGQAVQLASEVD